MCAERSEFHGGHEQAVSEFLEMTAAARRLADGFTQVDRVLQRDVKVLDGAAHILPPRRGLDGAAEIDLLLLGKLDHAPMLVVLQIRFTPTQCRPTD